jgi:hypothetical protein
MDSVVEKQGEASAKTTQADSPRFTLSISKKCKKTQQMPLGSLRMNLRKPGQIYVRV